MIAEEVKMRHKQGFPDRQRMIQTLGNGGEYQWRREGELHLFSPEDIHKRQ